MSTIEKEKEVHMHDHDPIRCFSCGKVLAQGKNIRYCCRRMMFGKE